MRTLFNLHRFFVYHRFYPLILGSMLAISLIAGRVVLSHEGTYIFLLWNLILAWLPYLFSLLIATFYATAPQQFWRLIPLLAVWLLFLPNAPYIVTDFVHFRSIKTFPWWYDLGLLATFALNGLLLGIVSLQIVQSLIARVFGRFTSWLFAFGVVGLSGLGIYLGRFARLNSWDIFFEPHAVLAQLLDVDPQAFGVTIVFSALLAVCYVTLTSQQNLEYLERETIETAGPSRL